MLTGNREFNEIYEKNKNLVMKAAYIYSGSYEAAEDIAQDTFLKLYIGFDHFRKDNIPSWLYTTAKNTALNYKKKAGKEVLDGGDPEKESSEEPSRESTEDEYFKHILTDEKKELHERIVAALMEKNPRWYEAIMLVYYLETPQAKAAEIMGIRVEVLHSLLHRAKKWIRKKYGVEYEEMNREV